MRIERFFRTRLTVLLLCCLCASIAHAAGKVYYCVTQPGMPPSIQDHPCPVKNTDAELQPVAATELTDAAVKEAMRRFDKAITTRDEQAIARMLARDASMQMWFDDGRRLKGGLDDILAMFHVSLPASSEYRIVHDQPEVHVEGGKAYFRSLTHETGTMSGHAFDTTSVEITGFKLVDGQVMVASLYSSPHGPGTEQETERKAGARASSRNDRAGPAVAAPEGYEWHSIEDAHASVLRPRDWQAKRTAVAGRQVLLLTSHTPGLQWVFDISWLPMEVEPREGEMKRRLDRIAEASAPGRAGETIVHHAGRMLSISYTADDTAAVRSFTQAIGNEVTGTLYLLSFRAPREQWDIAWGIAKPIFENLYLDDEF